jgi:putative membrane protein
LVEQRTFNPKVAGSIPARPIAVWTRPPVTLATVPFLLRILVAWGVDAAALAIAAWIFTGITVGGSVGTLIIAALVYGILATFIKPLLKLITLPLAIVTLGIAWFFVAMFILWLTDVIVSGFTINGFWTLVGGTIVVWLVGAVADHWLFPKKGHSKG